ncbi:hypothetical protein ACTJJ0_19920 [Chitinophaga sp. 22321]|uniref:Uncharacterized protein n=1 Tax=Chitinophaga hostae TaxID=2831022 RepID=A0ABS5IXL3_9BACT|nr:hypothetical protein [Chitinophaga hostae]MBS0027516.1 hypothetical protein [Chitinophaga hostae]
MKKRAAYILLLIFILHHTAFDQLLKIPALVLHYQEHHQRNSQLSVMDFLCMHYWGQDDDDGDHDRDMQLPYKTVDLHALQLSFIPLAKAIAVKQQTFREIRIDYPALKDNYLPEPALTSLFRPPKA